MSSYVTVLKVEDPKDITIDEEVFIEWLDKKDVAWWNDGYGLDIEEKDKVKEFIPAKISQVNIEKILTTDGDVGHLFSLTRMIIEYLEATGALKVVDQRLENEDEITIII